MFTPTALANGLHANHPVPGVPFSVPLVHIDTVNDEYPPLIIECPHGYPWGPGEREQYRVATDEEYERYTTYYNDLYDAEEGPEED